MWDFIFSTIWGWIGTAAVIAAACLAVAWFVRPLRPYAIAIGIAAIGFATAYSKGNRDRAALERRRQQEAVQKAQKDYADIDARPDSPDDVARRMRDGSF